MKPETGGRVALVGLPGAIARGVAKRLEAQGWAVRTFAGAPTWERLCADGQPAAVVAADDAAGELDGWRRRGLRGPVLLASDRPVSSVAAGASAFVAGPWDPDTLARAVDECLRPPRSLGRYVELSDRRVDLEASRVEGPAGTTSLSPNECKLLRYLAARPGRTLTRETLLAEVFGYRPGVRSRTVTTTMARLRGKTEADPAAPRHLFAVYGVGYRFEGGAPVHEGQPFFGREAERAAVREAGRLMTVIGPGGIGKTRLVREALPTAPFVDLSPARVVADVAPLLASALGARPGSPAAQLAALGRTTVVLDEAEHLVGFGPVVAAWLEAAPEVRLVVTSRRPLGLPTEAVLRVPPLDADAGLALFRDRVRQAGAADVDDAAARAVVRVADGVPLAIALLAGRARALSGTQLVRRAGALLGRDLGDLLAGSWALLSPAAQVAATQCQVFAGRFDLEDAEQVLALADDAWVVDVLSELVDHGWLEAERPGFRLLLPVAAWLRERHPAGPEVAVRHGEAFAALGSEASCEAVERHGGEQVFAQIRRSLADLFLAHDRAVARGDGAVAGRTAVAAHLVLGRSGPIDRAVAMVDRALSLPQDPLDEADLRILRTCLIQNLRGPEAMKAEWRRIEALGLRPGRSTWLRGRIAVLEGDTASASTLADRALGLLEHSGDRFALHALMLSAEVACMRCDHRREATLFERLVRMAEAFGSQGARAASLGNLAMALSQLGDLPAAVAESRRAERAYREVGDRFGRVHAGTNLTSMLIDVGELGAARALHDELATLMGDHGDRRVAFSLAQSEARIARAEGRAADAVAAHERALAAARGIGRRRHSQLHAVLAIMVRMEAMVPLDPAEAVVAIASLRRLEEESLGPRIAATATLALGILHRRAGDAEAAVAALSRAVDAWRAIGTIKVPWCEAELAAARGDVVAIAAAEQALLSAGARRWACHAAVLRAEVCAARGAWADARAALDEAAARRPTPRLDACIARVRRGLGRRAGSVAEG